MLIMFCSLSLLLGLSRQISLCHAVFVALGGTTLAHLQGNGMPFLPALVLCGSLTLVVGCGGEEAKGPKADRGDKGELKPLPPPASPADAAPKKKAGAGVNAD